MPSAVVTPKVVNLHHCRKPARCLHTIYSVYFEVKYIGHYSKCRASSTSDDYIHTYRQIAGDRQPGDRI